MTAMTEARWYKEQSESEQEEFREFVKRELHRGVVQVTFTKKDGSERSMNCTLSNDLVKQYEKKTDKVKEANLEVCPVFDVDKQEWRSFRFDSVKQFSGRV